ncbi:cytochrome P450, partial [Bipolaris maydis]
MALQDLIFGVIGAHVALTVTLTPLLILFIRSIYRVYFHPLAHIPGPILSKLTSLWLHYHAYIGDEASVIHKLHQQYGPYVRTIFSTTNQEYRAHRAKAVLPLFSTKSLRENEQAIWGCVDCMVNRLKEEAKTKRPVNVLNLTRSLAVDAVSTHLFSRKTMTALVKRAGVECQRFVDAFCGSRTLLLSSKHRVCWIEWAAERWAPNRETDDSMSLVDKFVATLVGNTTSKSTTYPGRLLAIGLSDSEVRAQCKDLIFAGTDSTGMNLATIMRSLVLHPEKYQRLKEEFNKNADLGPDAQDAQALPYLNAVVKE